MIFLLYTAVLRPLRRSSTIPTSREHRSIVQLFTTRVPTAEFAQHLNSGNRKGLQRTKGLGRRHAKSVNIITSALFASEKISTNRAQKQLKLASKHQKVA